jgi:pilus assembly protein CpaF
MLLAMTQGNDGSMCSVHADSSAGVFDRLAMYAVMTPERLGRAESAEVVANALDLVVFLTQERVEAGTVRRYVSSVREVRHAEGGDVVSNEVFRPGPDGRAVPTGTMSEAALERLEAAGYDRGWLDRPQGWWER